MKKILPCILCLSCVTTNLMVLQCAADLKRGYSLLQRGQRLEKRLITNLGGISFLDCVEECLRTTRCLSVNYFQPAHFCEVNFKKKDSVPRLYLAKPGWFYSERNDWDKVGTEHFEVEIFQKNVRAILFYDKNMCKKGFECGKL